MRCVERRGHLPDDRQRTGRSKRALSAQQRPQVGSLDVAHREIQDTVGVAGVVNRDDVGVLQRHRQLRLACEAFAECRFPTELGCH